MRLVLVLGANSYIGKKLLDIDFENSMTFGLSREPTASINSIGYRSAELAELLEHADEVVIINCVGYLAKQGPSALRESLRANVIFPICEIRWIERIIKKSVKVVQLASYWEDGRHRRDYFENFYVLSKKAFSRWLRLRKGGYLEVVIGDVIGPDDHRQKLLRTAVDVYPKDPTHFLVRPTARLELTRLESVTTFIQLFFLSKSGRVRLEADWKLSTREFVDEIYRSLGSGGTRSKSVAPSLTSYLEKILPSS